MSQKPTVDQYMTRSPHTIESNAPLDDAHKLMRKFSIRHLPVMSNGDLVGLLSLRDLHLIETLEDVDSAKVPIEDAMTDKPFVVEPDASVRDVAAKMAAHKFGSAIVVDDGEVVGMFTTIDALIALLHIFK